MRIDFSSQFQTYLTSHSEDIAHDAHLLSILSPLFGLANPEDYERWRLSSDLRYFEASNLIARMFQSSSALLRELSASLIAEGYDSIPADDFPMEVVEDQMKLIFFILEDL